MTATVILTSDNGVMKVEWHGPVTSAWSREFPRPITVDAKHVITGFDFVPRIERRIA